MPYSCRKPKGLKPFFLAGQEIVCIHFILCDKPLSPIEFKNLPPRTLDVAQSEAGLSDMHKP